jgi:hypothetical protein
MDGLYCKFLVNLRPVNGCFRFYGLNNGQRYFWRTVTRKSRAGPSFDRCTKTNNVSVFDVIQTD